MRFPRIFLKGSCVIASEISPKVCPTFPLARLVPEELPEYLSDFLRSHGLLRLFSVFLSELLFGSSGAAFMGFSKFFFVVVCRISCSDSPEIFFRDLLGSIPSFIFQNPGVVLYDYFRYFYKWFSWNFEIDFPEITLKFFAEFQPRFL